MRQEDIIQRAAVDYLEVLERQGRLTFFAVQNESQRSFKKTNWLKQMGMRPGAADLVILWKGGVGFVELKSAKGKQTENQVAFMESVCSFGHPYVIVRDMVELRGVLIRWGVLPHLRAA